MKVMVLAAGKGTRMLPLTATTPKPLLRAGGLSLIEHQLLKLRAAGFTEVVINHAWLGAQLEAALGDGARHGISIRWSPEPEPLETAGGIAQALPLLGDQPFAVVNADIWTDFPFAELRTPALGSDLVHLVLVQNPSHHPRGDFSLLDGERLALPAPETATWPYSGIGVFSPRLFAGLPTRKHPLLPLLQQAIAAGRASARRYGGMWLDVGTPERLTWLDQHLEQRT